MAFSPETKMPEDYIEAKQFDELFVEDYASYGKPAAAEPVKDYSSYDDYYTSARKKHKRKTKRSSSRTKDVYFNPNHRYKTM